jgi:hypothetical protein
MLRALYNKLPQLKFHTHWSICYYAPPQDPKLSSSRVVPAPQVCGFDMILLEILGI